jgi:hypothetical protein
MLNVDPHWRQRQGRKVTTKSSINLSFLLHIGTSSGCQDEDCQQTPIINVRSSDAFRLSRLGNPKNDLRIIWQTYNSTRFSVCEEQQLCTHQSPRRQGGHKQKVCTILYPHLQ